MKTLCKKHGKEYMDEQAPKTVIIKRDEDNCERCEEIKSGVNLKLFRMWMSNGKGYSEDVSEGKTIVAEDLEDARNEAVKLVMDWEEYKGGILREHGRAIREVSDCREFVKFRSYWTDWENGKKVKEYVFDSVNEHNNFVLELEGIVNFWVKELEIDNGYKIKSIDVEKLQGCKVGVE